VRRPIVLAALKYKEVQTRQAFNPMASAETRTVRYNASLAEKGANRRPRRAGGVG